MGDQPVYLRIPTENELPLFERHSCAEVVIGAVMKAQQTGYMLLHAFVVLPETLEMVATPVNMSVSALVGTIESETIPLLSVLIPNGGLIWNRYFMRSPLETQRSLDARLNMLLLSPVARGLAESAEGYAYSSSNPRYSGVTTAFTGFRKSGGLPQTSPLLSPDEAQETSPADSISHDTNVARSES
jgi:hypothetical protein